MFGGVLALSLSTYCKENILLRTLKLYILLCCLNYVLNCGSLKYIWDQGFKKYIVYCIDMIMFFLSRLYKPLFRNFCLYKKNYHTRFIMYD